MRRQQREPTPVPSAEALKQLADRKRQQQELAAFAIKAKAPKLSTRPADIIKAEVSPLALPPTERTVLPPSWAANIVSVDEARTTQWEALKNESLANAYPPPIPKLTLAQQQLYKRADFVETSSNVALATANASKDALALLSTTISFIVPKVIQDAPRYMLEGAVESIGVTFNNFDTSSYEQAARVDFFKIEQEAPLVGLSIALRRIMITLRNFKFNKAVAAAVLTRLYAILACFTKPRTGVVVYASYGDNKPLSDTKVKTCLAAMEECLDSANKFLCRFTSLDGAPASHSFPVPTNPTNAPTGPTLLPSAFASSSSSSESQGSPQPYVPMLNDPYALRPNDLTHQEALFYSLPNSSLSKYTPPSSSSSSSSSASRPLVINNVIGKRAFVCDYLIMAAVVGPELQEFFKTFHENLMKTFEDFLLEVGLSLVVLEISSALPDFAVFGNLDAEMKSSSETALLNVAKRSGSLEELQLLGGFSSIQARLDSTRAFINRRLTSYPHDILTCPPLKEWWFRSFGILQRTKPDEFVTMLAMESGGKADIETSRISKICDDLQAMLATKTLEKDGTLLLVEYARLFHPVPYDEPSIFAAIEISIRASSDKRVRLLPPLSDVMGGRLLVWDFFQESNLGRLFQDARGWRLITGPRGSGKTARLLSALQATPKERDVLYVDLSTCREISDVIHAIISQLLLRDCKNYDEFVDRFGEFIKSSVRTHAVLVFDNFEVDFAGKEAQELLIHGFESTVRKIAAQYSSKCLFVLVSSSYLPEALNRTPPKSYGRAAPVTVPVLTIPALSEPNALLLARELLPVDPTALVVAGRSLAGEMVRIAQACSLATIRKLAAIFTIDPNAYNVGKQCMMEGVEAELTADEKLCAACLLTGLPHFPEGHAWALCRAAFQDNLLRWRVAWQGLVDVGWVCYSTSLGFWLPSHALVTGAVVSTTPIDLASQVKSYLFYWAAELARVNGFSYDSSAYLLGHDMYRRHYRAVLCNFLSPTAKSLSADSKDVVTNELRLYNPKTELTPLGMIVAGRLERVLTMRYSDSFGLAVATGVLATLASYKEGVTYMKALNDVSSQLIRAKRLPEAEKIISSVTARAFVEFKDLALYDRAIFTASSANLLRLKGRNENSQKALAAAQAYLEADINSRSASEFTPGTLNWTKRSLLKGNTDQRPPLNKAAPEPSNTVIVKKKCCVM